MRTLLAVGLAVVVMFVGVTAVSESAQQAEPAVTTTPQQEAFDLGTSVFGGIAEAAGPAVVFGGVAAIVLGSLGLLVVAGRSGR